MDNEVESNDTPVLLVLGRGDSPGQLVFDVHTHHGWTVGGQLQDEFVERGLETEFVGYAQDAAHTALTVLSAAGGMAGIAAALNSFFQRHQHRKITVKTKRGEVTVEGFSAADTERLITEALGEEEEGLN